MLVITGTGLKCVEVTAVELIIKATLHDLGVSGRKSAVRIVSVFDPQILT
jgi:hypothetical protein